jgi:hypothetical protein
LSIGNLQFSWPLGQFMVSPGSTGNGLAYPA